MAHVHNCANGRVAAGNAQLWRKDFGADAALASVRVDPGDARRLVLCGQRGSLIVLKLNNMARDRVEQQQYKVDMSASKAGDSLRASFSTTRDLLYVLLPREARSLFRSFAPCRASAQVVLRLTKHRDCLCSSLW